MSMKIEDKGKVSVIVPVYNSERYLAKCIESLLIQKYSNIEILLINDGSTDMSGAICDNYSQKDVRIRVIHQKNMGVAAARNAGIKNAIGIYMCFVDADDWLPPNSIYDMVKGIYESNSEMCVGSIVRIFPYTKIEMKVFDNLVLMDDLKNVAEEVFIKESPLVFLAAKLYKTEIIKNFKLTYDHNMQLFEDACFVFLYLQHCNSVRFIGRTVYYYNQMMEASASRKFYVEYNKWAYLRYCKQVELIGEFKDSMQGKKLLDLELTRIFHESCRHYVNSILSDQEIEKRIGENIDLFYSMISHEGRGVFDKNFIEAIEKKDYKYVRNYYFKVPSENSSKLLYKAKVLIKLLCKKVRMFFILDVRIVERLLVLRRKYET